MGVEAWGRTRALRRVTASLIVLTTTVGLFAVSTHADARQPVRATASTPHASSTTTTTVVTTTTTTAPPTTVPPTTEPPTTLPPATEPPTTAAPAVMAAPVAAVAPGPPLTPAGSYTVEPYVGLGTWIDVYDWSETYGGGAVGLADIDRMASLGAQTLFVQATRWDADTLVLEPERLLALIGRAHKDGLRVVAWYLPDFADLSNDMNRLVAIAQLPVDGLAIDIESRSVEDVNERNTDVLALSAWLRQQLPGQVLSAIVLPPVVMEDVNPNYWPDYPWAGLAQYYDVWQPMSYWTNRRADWRDAYTYTAANIDRIRAHVGNPDAVVHTVGGIGDETTPDDVAGMKQAAVERNVIGASLYDYRTTTDDVWPALQQLRYG